MTHRRPASRWTGWGDPNQQFPITHWPKLEAFLKKQFSCSQWPQVSEFPTEKLVYPKSQLPPGSLEAFSRALHPSRVSQKNEVRLHFGYGKSYYDLMRLRLGKIDHLPDLVITPTTIEEIQKALTLCVDYHIACIPFGGGTSVVGGVETLQHPTVVMNLGAFNRLLSVDTYAHIAHVQAGMMGPALEQALNAQGFTLGHFPQSFEYSTVGGWVATRSAGQFSCKYGKIEHRVIALSVMTPQGLIQTQNAPAAATGPRWAELFVGSEGTLGIISDVWLKIDRVPHHQVIRGYSCATFEKALELCHDLSHLPIKPHLIRLSDATETTLSWHLGLGSGTLSALVSAYLSTRGHHRDERCLLLLGFSGAAQEVRSGLGAAHSILRTHRCVSLGQHPGRTWMKHRFEHPYLRDALLDIGLMVDTFETACSWSELKTLYQAIVELLRTHLPSQTLCLGHVSHVYETGASLYFTIITPQDTTHPLEQWQQFKAAVSTCIVQQGGVISHHHGIGRDHLKYFQQQAGIPTLELFKSLKTQLDPSHVLNPGKLIPPD